MDSEALEAVAGALTAQGFIMENLYAYLLSQNEKPVETAREAGAEIVRQYRAATGAGANVPGDNQTQRIVEHGLRNIEKFWANVETRLRSGGLG